jgi:small subunit ribosomal protein S3
MVVERKFIKDKMREQRIKEYLSQYMERVGFSHIDIQKTPVGFSIIIHSSKPGLIVGRKGINIKEIQDTLQNEFKLESPVVEVQEVSKPELDAQIMAEQIGNQLRKFGVARFKAIGHKATEKMIEAGAVGAEVKIAGKVPSTRARFWKFYAGYLPKCGDIAVTEVRKGYKSIKLKPGVVGITVKLLPPGIIMPDRLYPKVQSKTVKAVEVKQEVKKRTTKEVKEAPKKEQKPKEEPAKAPKKEEPKEEVNKVEEAEIEEEVEEAAEET